MPVEWKGSRLASCDDFPILVKFIFPRDKLSIQVHPDDAYAAIHEQAAGGRGKTEMWHAVSAEAGARVLLGLKQGTTRIDFLQAMKEKRLEEVFQPHFVKAGDTFFVAPGTPHTIWPGMILCEVQEYSDLTYRVYDYERVDENGDARELHIEKALEAMRFGAAPPCKLAALSLPGENMRRTLLAACSYFAAERWEFRGTVQTESLRETFTLLVFLDGTGYLHWQGAPLEYRPGECWFIPAALGKFSLQPEQSTTAIRVYVPDLQKLRGELHDFGVPESQLAQSIFA